MDKGWLERGHRSQLVFWIKAFPEDRSRYILSSIDLPLSAEMYMEIVDPKIWINKKSGVRLS